MLIIRGFISLIAMGAVAYLGRHESTTGNSISPRVYGILAGGAFGASIEDVIKIADRWLNRNRQSPPSSTQ